MRHLLAALALTVALPAHAAVTAGVGNYTLDKEHTNVVFFVNHLGFSDMVGRFDEVSGTFSFDPQKPEASKVDVTLKPSSVQTSSKKLDEHLQGADFFNTKQFPEIHFVSTGVKKTGAADGELTGNLTLLGVTKPVVLAVHFNKADYHPMSGAWMAGFNATGTIKRSDFGMNKYVPMVGDEVKLFISTEGVDANNTKPVGEEKKK